MNEEHRNTITRDGYDMRPTIDELTENIDISSSVVED